MAKTCCDAGICRRNIASWRAITTPSAGTAATCCSSACVWRISSAGVGGEVDPEVVPAASEEAAALCLGEVQLADLEVNLEDKLGLEPA